jgi:hypothetical protein
MSLHGLDETEQKAVCEVLRSHGLQVRDLSDVTAQSESSLLAAIESIGLKAEEVCGICLSEGGVSVRSNEQLDCTTYTVCLAVAVFNDAQRALDWLRTSKRALQGESPIDLTVDGDTEQVVAFATAP